MIDREVAKIINKYCNKMCNEVRNDWTRLGRDIHGNAEIDFKITSKTAGTIIGQFSARGQKAWICEFGSGSAMKPLSLDKYRSSKYWNPLRRGKGVQGRPAGDYYDLDDNLHTSSGVRAGQDLEKSKRFVPKQPRRVIRRILFDKNSSHWIGMMVELREAVKREIALQITGIGGKLTMRI